MLYLWVSTSFSFMIHFLWTLLFNWEPFCCHRLKLCICCWEFKNIKDDITLTIMRNAHSIRIESKLRNTSKRNEKTHTNLWTGVCKMHFNVRGFRFQQQNNNWIANHCWNHSSADTHSIGIGMVCTCCITQGSNRFLHLSFRVKNEKSKNTHK